LQTRATHLNEIQNHDQVSKQRSLAA
jgi:hypothetical protein